MKPFRLAKKAVQYGGRHLAHQIDYHQGKGWSAPDRVSITITTRCNARCLMCSAWKNTVREEDTIPAARWIEIIDELHGWIGPFFLTLSGGEVFTKPGIFDIIKRAVSHDISLNILTNGIMFRSDAHLEKLFDSGLKTLIFSLDGMNSAVHNRFRGSDNLHETVVEVIRKIKARKPSMTITTTCIVMKDTVAGLVDYALWARDIGANYVQFQPIAPTFYEPDTNRDWYRDDPNFVRDLTTLDSQIDRLLLLKQSDDFIINTVDHLEKMKEYFRNPNDVQIKKEQCLLGQTNLNITETGDMSFCYKHPTPFGNVNAGPIRDTWRGPEAVRWRGILKKCRIPCLSMCYRSPTLGEKISLFFRYARSGKI